MTTPPNDPHTTSPGPAVDPKEARRARRIALAGICIPLGIALASLMRVSHLPSADASAHTVPATTTTSTQHIVARGALTASRALTSSSLSTTVPSTTTTPKQARQAPSSQQDSTSSVLAHGGKILVIGDSISQDLGAGLHYELDANPQIQVINFGKPSSGLTIPSFYDWPSQLPSLLDSYKPSLVVVLLGANDARALELPSSSPGSPAASLTFGTPVWGAEYRWRVRQLASEATSTGATLLYLGAPVMADPSYAAEVTSVNAQAAAAIAQVPGASFVSTWSWLSPQPGRFVSSALVNGQLTGLRIADGIHPTEAGWNLMATTLVSYLHAHDGLKTPASHPLQLGR